MEKRRGQGMVEFALIFPILLLVIFGIIEVSLIVQGYLTVQHAAREAARFAVSYQPLQGTCVDKDGDGHIADGFDMPDDPSDDDDIDDLDVYPACPKNNAGWPEEPDDYYYTRRVKLIKQAARRAATGLRMESYNLKNTDFSHDDEPRFFGVKVWGFPDYDKPPEIDHPGIEGLPMRVQVTHNVEIADPIYRSLFSFIAGFYGGEGTGDFDYVPVQAEARMINEGAQAGSGNKIPPTWPPSTVDPDELTPLPTDTPGGPTPPPTVPPPPAYNIELFPDGAINHMPDDRAHEFTVLVTNEEGQNVERARIGFSTDRGAFDYSGLEPQYAKGRTDDQGQVSVMIYGNYSETATIHAWLDSNYNDERDTDEPFDVATKTWTFSETVPYIVVKDHDVFPLAYDYAGIMNHEPNGEYTLWWCFCPKADIITTEITTPLLEIRVNHEGDATDVGFTIPKDSKGMYRLETHPSGGGGCGAGDPVARSADIRVRDTPPNLVISIAEPMTVCAGIPFTVTAEIDNPTPGRTDEAFDVDFYVDPESIPPWSPIGASKQWLVGIAPLETKVVNAVLCMDSPGEHTILAWVDTTDYVEEQEEGDNTNVITLTLAACEEEAQCPVQEIMPPGLEICHQHLRAGGFEGSPGIISSFWSMGGEGAYKLQSKSHAGIASMRLHASLSSYENIPSCAPYSPHISQTVQIPDEVYTMTTVHVRGWRFVANSETDCSYHEPDDRAGPEAEDVLYLQMKDSSGGNLGDRLAVVNGGVPPKTWADFELDVTDVVDPYNHPGREMQVYFDGYHDEDGTDTWFYLDDLECETCTVWPTPVPIPGTISIGGEVRVFIGGYPRQRQGVDVWAYSQAAGGGSYHTVTIQDSTYHFYNVPPGDYTIYAETWIKEGARRVLRFATITVEADENRDDLNLFLY